MGATKSKRVAPTDERVAAAMAAARSLGRALGESSVFKRYENALEVFQADDAAQQRLRDFQDHQEKYRLEAMWGGADRREEDRLEREWRSLSSMPSLSGFLGAQEELTALLRETVGKISAEIGVDFGAACSPAGGCC